LDEEEEGHFLQNTAYQLEYFHLEVFVFDLEFHKVNLKGRSNNVVEI
jgi:hypothetical protein